MRRFDSASTVAMDAETEPEADEESQTSRGSRRPPPAPGRAASLREFHEFSKRMKLDAGLTIRTIAAGGDVVELDSLLADTDDEDDEEDAEDEEDESSSDGVSEGEFVVDPEAALRPDTGDESHLDPETGDIVVPEPVAAPEPPVLEEPPSSASTALADKLKEMAEISVKPVRKDDAEAEEDDDKSKSGGTLNVRRNIREVMDEKQLDESTLSAQRLELERLARLQEQQRIIREVRRQIALGRQDKTQARVLQLLQGRTGSSVLKKTISTDMINPASQKLNLPDTVLMKLPSGEMKKVPKPIPQDQLKMQRTKCNLTPSVSIAPVTSSPKLDINKISPMMKKEVVEIVDSSSSSSESESAPSSDSDDCIMLSDSELPPSPEPEEDPQNSGLHVNDTYNVPDDQGRVVINIGHPENEEDIFLAPQIGRIIKPHQIGGVRFLFDNIIESVERFSTSTGFGCILAHSMGLGKTLQIVCFCDIFLRHTSSKTVLCIMPINTLQNWVAEFNMWLPLDASLSPLNVHGEVRPRLFPIYVLNDSHKTLQARAKVIKEWNDTGGVLMIGYELYRLLSLKKNKKPRARKKKLDPPIPNKIVDNKILEIPDENETDKQSSIFKTEINDKSLENNNSNASITMDSSRLDDFEKSENIKEKTKEDIQVEKKEEDDDTDEEKKLLDEMYSALVKPGPDLVICDEGHRIKNSHSNISNALKQMRTKRRIVLTGYPLQNNLLEYWCMVDFVRPNYLGTKTEFSNMFERPIQNGQCIDSTPQDIRLMRYRAHVLHSLLVGFVQRRSHAVLQSTLPQKEEYVLLVRMTDLQRKLYDTFMNDVVRVKTVPNPLKAFAVCCKIWNHPDVLYYFLKKRSDMAAVIDFDLEIEDNSNLNANNQTTNNKKGKKPKAPSKKKEKAPLATSTNDGKPAATIPPNTSNANSNFSSDTTKSIVSNGPQSFPSGSYSTPQNKNSYGQPIGQPQQNHYPPYQNYQQYPQSNYFGQNGSYDPNFGNGYYPNQTYNNEYNNYNLQNTPTTPDTSNPGHQAPPQQYNHPQGYWGSDGNYYNQANPGFYPNPQNNYQSNQDPYSSMYSQFPQHSQSFNEYDQNRTYNNSNAENNSQNFSASLQTPRDNFQPSHTNNATSSFENPQPSSSAPASNNYSNTPYSDFQNAPVMPAQSESKPHLNDDISTLCWPVPSDDATKQENTTPVPNPLLNDIKNESKADSDNEIKIADLDTKKVIINDKPKYISEIAKCEEKSEIKPECENTVKPSMDTIDDKDAVAVDQKDDDKSKIGDIKPKGKVLDKKPREKSKSRDTKKSKTAKDKLKGDKDGSDIDSDIEVEKKEDIEKKPEYRDEVTYEWATELLKNYIPGVIENSAKMEIFFCILQESVHLGDRLLLFSQSLFTLNLIEDFLQRNIIPKTEQHWMKNKSYFRLDGSTSALEREKLINEFNSNPGIHLFLVSTRAGSLGINLVGANRVIVFDASWNPCHDTQAVCRVYRYGQQKPCFVYRLVMDYCLEKKIYDRQINKQGMADRVVDECNPDAVLSMKEVTNLCWDNDEKEPAPVEFSDDCKDKYVDLIMQNIILEHAKTLSKEPFQHESLLVDRKEKKLSSAEKRLAQRGYELEKKAASNPKPNLMYRTIRAADGTLIQRPVASVRPMPHGGTSVTNSRWIPAEVWQRQGMTAQEMTLPLDVVIPTNSVEKSNIVLKAGQKVMVLKSPKGIYMQLESGKIIAIKTSFKVGQNKTPEIKEIPKKTIPVRPTNVSLPGSLKNNSAITVISKSARGGMQKVITRPSIIPKKIGTPIRPIINGPRILDTKVRQLNPNLQMRPVSVFRGRGGQTARPSRPIPIQNNLNIKIQGPSMHQKPNTNLESRDFESNLTDEEFDNVEFNASPGSSKITDLTNDISKSENELSENPEKEQDQNVDNNESLSSEVTSEHLQSFPEEMISEDSSQEKTYVDLSNRSESKIMTKTPNKRTLIADKSPPLNSTFKECNIQIKNSGLGTSPMDVNFGSDLTIKRTNFIHNASSTVTKEKPFCNPVHISSESFTSESFTELPVSQSSFSSDENMFDSDVVIKEKNMYKPNIDKMIKPSALKNYRHQKFNQRLPIQNMDFHMDKVSPGSTSSTPTPPPIINLPIQCSTKVTPEKFVSSISQLEKTASSINRSPKKGGISDFQQTLSDITRVYPTETHSAEPYKPGPKSRKKKNSSTTPRIETQTFETSETIPSASEKVENRLNINSSVESTPLQTSSSTMPSIPASQPTSFNQLPYNSLPEPTTIPSGFTDPAYQQPMSITEPILPQQPYSSFPSYPPAGGAYPPYPPGPYYQPYPPTTYPPYAQYPVPPAPYPPTPPYQHSPYTGYPTYPNTNPHPW